MSTNNQVPSTIAEIIESKRQTLLEERRQKEEKDRREREEVEAIGRAKYDEYIQASLQKVPEYLRQYVAPTEEVPDFYRIGEGWDKPDDWLYFQVPGLVKILFAPLAKGDAWKWQNARPFDQSYDYDGNPNYKEPSLDFAGHQYGWTDDVEYALGCAHAQMQKYQEFLAEWVTKQEEIAREAEQRKVLIQDQEVRGAEKAARREQEQAKEKAEEQALFDAIKDDPVALNMLKTFVLIHEERGSFRDQLENADWALYNMEERHARRAEELRRQADEIERRAEDEKYGNNIHDAQRIEKP